MLRRHAHYSARRTPSVVDSEPALKQPSVKQPKAHEGIAGIAARVGPERAGAILRSSQVAMAFEALGDRWSALMLREIFLGARRFEELVAATGANRATLTSRLRSLVDEGILHRHPYQVRPTRYEYRLTRMGADLYPTALMYWLWERRYGGSSPDMPQRAGAPAVRQEDGAAARLPRRAASRSTSAASVSKSSRSRTSGRSACRSTACTSAPTRGARSRRARCTSST